MQTFGQTELCRSIGKKVQEERLAYRIILCWTNGTLKQHSQLACKLIIGIENRFLDMKFRQMIIWNKRFENFIIELF